VPQSFPAASTHPANNPANPNEEQQTQPGQRSHKVPSHLWFEGKCSQGDHGEDARQREQEQRGVLPTTLQMFKQTGPEVVHVVPGYEGHFNPNQIS